MNSRDLKTLGFCWLRFGKQYPVVATEAGHYHADVLGISEDEAVEIEVKVSRHDLNADAEKNKHKLFNCSFGDYSGPNRFYYLVPEVLKQDALELVAEVNDKYGVMIARADHGMNYKCHELITVVKRAKVLHPTKPSDGLKKQIIARMSSELAGWYLKAAADAWMIAAIKQLECNKDVESGVSQ